MSKISRKIGNQIRERRTAMKMTQDEFAKKVGFSPAIVSHWETGRRAFSIDSLEMIAFVLQCKVGDFFDEIKQPKKVLCPTCNGHGVISELIKAAGQAMKNTPDAAFLHMVEKRLGDCTSVNVLQRIDILRHKEHLLHKLYASIAVKASEVVFPVPDDAHDLTDLLSEVSQAISLHPQ